MNGAISVKSRRTPKDVLEIIHSVEDELGRVRRERWAPRVCDIDLIASGGMICPSVEIWRHWADLPLERQLEEQPSQLILPHPRLHERGFVLKPLADIAPDWVHPVLNLTVEKMLEALPGEALADVREI